MTDENQNNGENNNIEKNANTMPQAKPGDAEDSSLTAGQWWNKHKYEAYFGAGFGALFSIPAAIAWDATKAAGKAEFRAALKKLRTPASVPGGEKPPVASPPGGAKPTNAETADLWVGRWSNWLGVPKEELLEASTTQALEAARVVPFEPAAMLRSQLLEAEAAQNGTSIGFPVPEGDIAALEKGPAAAPAESASRWARTVDAVESGAGRVPGYFGKAGSIAAKAWAFANEPIPYLTPVMDFRHPVAPWLQRCPAAWDSGKGICDASAEAKEAYDQREKRWTVAAQPSPAIDSLSVFLSTTIPASCGKGQ